MTEWKPIETAPRNGQWILVSGFKTRKRGPVSHICVVAGWFPISHFRPEVGYEWFYGTRGEEFIREPTHWMELPSVPGEIKKPPKVKKDVEVLVYSRRRRKPMRKSLAKSLDENPVTGETK